MKQKIQLIFASFLLVSTSVVISACDKDDWEADDSVLTDVSHGGLTNHHVVATGEAQNVTHNSATILFSTNYNYKTSLNIKSGIIYSKTESKEYDLRNDKTNVTEVKLNDFVNSACDITLNDLEQYTTYYYRAYAEADGGDHYGEIKSFTTGINPSGEAVDLGLSVKWASCNIGASNPEGWGLSFYWGGTLPTNEYSHNESWHSDPLAKLESLGYIDGNGNLCPLYDAATQIWGGKWRMPTKDELNELIDKCTWTKTYKSGIEVFEITGPNGNVIYLPCTDHWTSTYYVSSKAYYLEYGYYSYYEDNIYRSRYYNCEYTYMKYGCKIRPVIK